MQYGKCQAKYIRCKPRRARLVADLIRGKSVDEARLAMDYCNQEAGFFVRKALDSAIANAETQHDVRPEDLVVLAVYVDEGPTWKRARARSRGMRNPILKRTSHVTVVIGKEF